MTGVPAYGRPVPPRDEDPGAWRVWAESLPFSIEMGMSCEEIGTGHVRMTFDGADYTRNPNGAIHGGLVLAGADQVMGVAAMTVLEPGQLPATATLQTSFLRPAFGPLVYVASVSRAGRTLAFVEAVALDCDGKQCASCSGTWSVNGSAVPKPS